MSSNKYFFATVDYIPNRDYEIIGTIILSDSRNHIFNVLFNSAYLDDQEHKQVKAFFECHNADAVIGIRRSFNEVRKNNKFDTYYIGTLIKFTDEEKPKKVKSIKNKKELVFK